jgi:hypothetical protein
MSLSKKEKRKESVCLWQEVISIYFWVIDMSYYRGTIERDTTESLIKMSECSIFQILRFAFLAVSSNISNQIGYFHRVLESWHCFSIGYIRPQVGHIWRIRLIWAWSGSSTVTVWHGRTYLTLSQICSVLVGFQNGGKLSKSDISDPRSNISNPPDLFDLHRVPKVLHPSLIRYIWAPADISDPTEFESVWISHRTYLI